MDQTANAPDRIAAELDAEPPDLEARSASAEAQAERHETSRELAAAVVGQPEPGA